MLPLTRLPFRRLIPRLTLLVSCQLVLASPLPAAEPVRIGSSFAAQDTLSCGQDASQDAQQCLEGLRWKATDFTVRCEESPRGRGDFLVRFPSPIDTGDQVNDQVAMEWYAARDAEHNILQAPAVVVVHESGSNMAVGRMIARGLQTRKLHAFLIQLPGYGVRKTGREILASEIIAALRQSVADVRRARDAVAVLPHVDTAAIALQGTSLGGFVTATVAGLDRGYNRTFILLAGGNLQAVIEQGDRDSAKLRNKLKEAGIEGEQLRELTQAIEPMRLAHRIDPRTTWLYSGALDDVVPPACSRALAEAARLPADHHIVLPVDHYSGIILLPKIILEMQQAIVTPQDGEI